MRRYSPLLDEDNILLFYIKKLLIQGKNLTKGGERFRVDLSFAHNLPSLRRHGSTSSPPLTPSQGTLTRPVRSRTSPIILNTNYTDKDRKPNEQPHGDPSAHKEPTRPSRTSSYLNSFSPNWRPQDTTRTAFPFSFQRTARLRWALCDIVKG